MRKRARRLTLRRCSLYADRPKPCLAIDRNAIKNVKSSARSGFHQESGSEPIGPIVLVRFHATDNMLGHVEEPWSWIFGLRDQRQRIQGRVPASALDWSALLHNWMIHPPANVSHKELSVSSGQREGQHRHELIDCGRIQYPGQRELVYNPSDCQFMIVEH